MTAQNVIASAPLGHALATQKSDIAPTDRKTRTAAMEGGSQSGTCKHVVPLDGDHVAWIDHLLLSPQAADRLQSVAIDKEMRGRDKASDHTPVRVELAL